MEHKKYYYKLFKEEESPVSVKKVTNTTGDDEVLNKDIELRRVNSLKKIDIKITKNQQ